MKSAQFSRANNPEGLVLILEAALFAADAHKTQLRKGAGRVPYINHPLEVAATIVRGEPNASAEIIAAALLHDTVEDTETTPEQLRALFGEKVCGIVLEVTEPPKDAFTWKERKAHQLAHAPTLSREARMVKLGDIISNLRSLVRATPKEWTHEKQQGQFDRGKALANCFRGASASLEAEFDAVFAMRPVSDLRIRTGDKQ